MNFTDLTSPELIQIKAHYTSPDQVIIGLAEILQQQGKIKDKDAFLQSVFAREQHASTALAEGFAIPHGKTNAVNEAAFAVATLDQPILWKDAFGDEVQIRAVFLLAIPEQEAGSTHMQLLAKLASALADEERTKVLAQANSSEEVLSLLRGETVTPAAASVATTKPAKSVQVSAEDSLPDDAPVIVCVTACPAGIAHTYMAAEYLEKAGRKLGYRVHVEKQGANGIDGRLTAQQLNEAKAAVFAADVAVKDVERFAGIPRVEVSVAEPLKHAEKILNQAIEESKQSASTKRVVATEDRPKKQSVKTELKQALLSGISYAVPLIVAGGTVLAVAVLISQMFGLQAVYDKENSWLWMYRKLGGGLLGTLMIPVLSAYTAYSLADKPALGPGFAAGLAANMIGSGFLGGVVGGLLAGYFMRWVKTHIRLSPTFNGFLTFYLYPVIGTLVVGSLMLFVVGKPVAWLNQSLTAWLNSLSGANAILLGAVLGLFVSFDLGGPVNKAAYAFCLGAMANGVYAPYAIFASVKMVSAFTVTGSTMIAPRLFKDFEIELGKSTWLLGLAGITEGAIPMAIEDPIRVIGSFLVGSAVTGAIVGASGIGLSTPGAGIFSLFLLQDNGMGSTMAAATWFFAAIIGTVISTAILLAWRASAVKRGKFTVAE